MLFFSSYFLLWLIVIIVSVLLVNLYRSLSKNSSFEIKKMDSGFENQHNGFGFPLGDKFPDLHLQTVFGEEISISSISSPYTMVIYTSADCGSCKRLNPFLAPFQERHPELKIIILMLGDESKVRETIEEYSIHNIPVSILTEEIMDETRTTRFPIAYLLLDNRQIMMKGLVLEEKHLEIISSVRDLRVPWINAYLW